MANEQANVLKVSVEDLATSSGENVDRRDLLPEATLKNTSGFFFSHCGIFLLQFCS